MKQNGSHTGLSMTNCSELAVPRCRHPAGPLFSRTRKPKVKSLSTAIPDLSALSISEELDTQVLVPAFFGAGEIIKTGHVERFGSPAQSLVVRPSLEPAPANKSQVSHAVATGVDVNPKGCAASLTAAPFGRLPGRPHVLQ